MHISVKREFIWSDLQGRYILIKDLSINWTGSVALAKGASAGQETLANDQAAFYSQLTQDYSQQFAGQQAILNTLQNTLNPIIAAGPNQMGFNAAQLATLNAGAVQGTGQQYANAAKALRENQAAAGGGNIPLPSGVANQQQAQLAAAAAGQSSNELMDIQQKGYQQGYNQYQAAIGGLENVSGQMNPLGYAGATTGAGQAAFNAATTVQQMNNAASPWNLVGGILGGAAGAGIDAMTGGLGYGLANDIMGGGNPSQPSPGAYSAAMSPSVIPNPYAGLGAEPVMANPAAVYAGLGGQ